MSNKERNLLESVIHITEERDKKSLERVLAKTLYDYIKCSALVIFRVIDGLEGELLEETASIPEEACADYFKLAQCEYGLQRIMRDSSINACIQSRKTISEEIDGVKRVLFPLVIKDQVTSILFIIGEHCSSTTEKLVQCFLRIHSNFLAIIDDNEHDTLTGLLNRKTFDARISALLSLSSSKVKSTSPTGEERRHTKDTKSHWLGVMDIDHFKKVNDNFGHVYGDEVLLLFSDMMKKTFRSRDLLFRYGGEEFVVVLSQVDEKKAFSVFERFRKKLERFDFPQIGQVTVSIGIVEIAAQDHPSTVVEHADQALYYAKEQGRNQTFNYNALINAGLLKERRTAGDIELF